MSALAPITPFPVVFDTEHLTAVELAETYSTMLDELAAIVEDSTEHATLPGRVIARRLGELSGELDELTARSRRARVVNLTNEVDDLHRYVDGVTFTSAAFRTVLVPLAELHEALVDLIAANGWEAIS